jgi:hypothetical protein
VADSVRLTFGAAVTYTKIGRLRIGSPTVPGDYGYGTESAAGGRRKIAKSHAFRQLWQTRGPFFVEAFL